MLADVSLGRQPRKDVLLPSRVGEGPVLFWEDFKPQKCQNSVATSLVSSCCGWAQGWSFVLSPLFLNICTFGKKRSKKESSYFAECGLCPALLFAMLSSPEKIILATVFSPACRFGTLAWMLWPLFGDHRGPPSPPEHHQDLQLLGTAENQA